MAKTSGTSLLAKIPIDPELAELCDKGEIERYSSDAFDTLTQNFVQALPLKAKLK